MSSLVLGAWLLQAAVGVVLLRGWLRHGRRGSASVLPHVVLSVAGLALWIAYVVADQVAWGWAALGLITIGNGLGDHVLIGRGRRLTGLRTSYFGDYRRAIAAVFQGRLPKPVTFHAIFAGVVYFGALAACLVGTLA